MFSVCMQQLYRSRFAIDFTLLNKAVDSRFNVAWSFSRLTRAHERQNLNSMRLNWIEHMHYIALMTVDRVIYFLFVKKRKKETHRANVFFNWMAMLLYDCLCLFFKPNELPTGIICAWLCWFLNCLFFWIYSKAEFCILCSNHNTSEKIHW